MSRPFLALACTLALAVHPSTLPAQGPAIERAPARPRLPEEADSNDAVAYYQFGASLLPGAMRQPEAARRAAAAFHWASRLDPRSADAVYARRVALLLEDRERLRIYMEDSTGARSTADTRLLDSIMLRAVRLDPFLREDAEAMVISRYAEIVGAPEARRGGMLATEADVSPADLRAYIPRFLREQSPALRARYAYCEGRFDSALVTWTEIARRDSLNARLQAERARAFYHSGRLDSSRVALERALALGRRADADTVRAVYESKAMWEYGLGRVLERLGAPGEARAAYERALIEDLTWFPAHLRLGELAFAAGDTAGAMREFGRAVLSAEDEYLPHASYGYRLATLGRLDSAVVHLRRATAIEPFAVESWLMLGLVYDARRDSAEAVAVFRTFVALARRDHPRLVSVRARLAASPGP